MGGASHISKWRNAIGFFLFQIAFLSLAAESSDSTGLISPHATIILLSGLPGDLQSETAYHEQLQNWLELLENLPGPPQQVFAFSDSPDSLTLPAKLSAKKLKSNREEFLAVGKTLAGQTNPLTIIVWGHGGLQGNTPVFHVTGPRLTAADFKSFAAQMPQAESRWLLFFRGSAKFAAELAADHRWLITSEKETAFNSDPVGLPLILKALRVNPASPLPALGTELGRATAAWYKERNLVRTEEPTFWTAKEPPQLLTPPEAESAPGEKSSNESLTSKSSGSPITLTNLSAAWKDITRVEPRSYPDADGVVLRRRITYTLSGGSPAISSDRDEFVQVLTAEGKHLGDFDFSFSPPDEDITFLDCEVWEPDGKLLSLDPEGIRDAAGESWGDYHSSQRKVFSMPGIQPGAVLRVHYRTTWKMFPFPYISLSIPVAAELPILDSSIQVSLPKEAAFHFVFDQITAPDPAIKQTTYGSSYSWQFQNLPAHEPEALSPPEHEPALLISTFPDWESFADWYSRISQLSDLVTPELAAKAAEITGGAKTDQERAALLFNYVTGLRYVAVPLGVNSFRPHTADHVFKNQYGDCKDKANLYNALLHSLKIDAHLVLVPRFTQAHEAVPGFAFNHAISQIKLGGETVWVDTTDDVCRFGMLPPGDPGRRVLVIDSKSTSLAQLPAPSPRAHQLKIEANINCSEGTDVLASDVDATAQGFSDYELRTAAQDYKGHKSSLPLLAVHYRPANGVFALKRQSHTAPGSLTENFSWHGEGFYAAIISSAGEKRSLRAPFWLPKEWDAALNQRKSALFLHQGYPLVLDEELKFLLPEKTTQITLPAKLEGALQPLTWQIDWTSKPPFAVASLHVELSNGELSTDDTPALQKELRLLFSALAAQADFTLPP